MTPRLSFPRILPILLLVVSTLVLAACWDDIHPTPTERPSPTALAPTPTAPPPTPTPQPSVVDQLKMNAEEFEYTTGKHGGNLTFATVSEPLTFNSRDIYRRLLLRRSRLPIRRPHRDFLAH